MASGMTERERVWAAVRHRQPDRVPYNIIYTLPAQRKLEAYYGTSDLETALGNHLAKYRARLGDADGWLAARPGFFRDEWGVVWNRTIDSDIGVVDDYVLTERSLAGLLVPDAGDPRRYAGLPAFIAANRDKFRYVSVSYSLFERAWSLRGMAELMIDMLEAPQWVDQLFDAIAEHNMQVLQRVLTYDIDGVMFGDDWGQQNGLLFGPRLWRRFILPRITAMYGAVKRTGKVVIIHCCGKVQELFPDLIEAGLDVFNPFQPDVMDPYEIKRRFGDRLAFYGGMSVQNVLPRGTPQQVRDEARRMMDGIGQGGGFIIGPSHSMPADVPLENMVAFIEAVRQG
jgi:uroporphyrinogen decarboxylase